MSARIDHFMYAVPDMDRGIAWAADLFGVEPAYGGEHVGVGTRNALLSLGDTYLEIIAPDPQQSLSGNMGEKFAALSTGGLITWAVQGELASIASTLKQGGVKTRGPKRTERKTTDGTLLVWELLFPMDSRFGGRMPFFIDWLDCEHPSKTNPVAGELVGLSITSPQADELNQLFQSIGLEQSVEAAEESHLSVHIQTPGGALELASTDETRLISMG